MTCNYSSIDKDTYRVYSTANNVSVDELLQWLKVNCIPLSSSISNAFDFVRSSRYKIELDLTFFYSDVVYYIELFGGESH